MRSSSTALFARPETGESVVLIHIDLTADDKAACDEFIELARSAGTHVCRLLIAPSHRPNPKYFVGTGKLAEIKQALLETGASAALFSYDLTPSQARNLEQYLQCRVLDRSALILDIFAQRARSFEGKLQVELAQLKYISTRLVRGWTHLERQKGGIGLRGPGETQLESDRRMVALRIKQLQKRLQKVSQRRQLGRHARQKRTVPTVSLVGYTNAGKSTLFNAVTGAACYAADQLFATLDPTLRRVSLASSGDIVLADTVGFIRDLPHDLVAAFRSTLQEIREANLLLHVVDSADETQAQQIRQVEQVLRDIQADRVARIIVYNKIDMAGKSPRIVMDQHGQVTAIYLSAVSGEGLPLLLQVLQDFFQYNRLNGWVELQPNEGRSRARLYALGEILEEQVGAQGQLRLHVKIERTCWAQTGLAIERLQLAQDKDTFIPAVVAGAA